MRSKIFFKSPTYFSEKIIQTWNKENFTNFDQFKVIQRILSDAADAAADPEKKLFLSKKIIISEAVKQIRPKSFFGASELKIQVKSTTRRLTDGF